MVLYYLVYISQLSPNRLAAATPFFAFDVAFVRAAVVWSLRTIPRGPFCGPPAAATLSKWRLVIFAWQSSDSASVFVVPDIEWCSSPPC